MAEKEPTLSFNRETGMYEGMLKVEVDAEIFRRLLLRTVEEDTTADLTDPQTWVAAIARVGKIVNWLDKPHVKVTPITTSQVQYPPVPAIVPVISPIESSRPKTQAALIEEELREKAKYVAPYRWIEILLTPYEYLPPGKEKEAVFQRRHKERRFLEQLRREWEQGNYQLDPEAVQQEEEHQADEQRLLAVKIETVQSAINGARIH